MTSMCGRSLSASATQRLTYFRRSSHLTFLPFASALHELIACLSARLSALDSFAVAAAAGIHAVPPPATTMVIMHVNTVAVKRDIRQSPQLCPAATYDTNNSRRGPFVSGPPETSIASDF